MKKSPYALTVAEIETLASENVSAQAVTSRVGITYLRVLVVSLQATLGPRGRGRHVKPATQLEALEHCSTPFYEAVLRGVTTPEVAHDATANRDEQRRRAFERNRRSAFARVSKSALASYIKAGGDVRTLDADTVARDPLQAHARQARGASESAYQLDRLAGRVLRIAKRAARTDVDAAKAELRKVIESLQAAYDELTIDDSQPTATTILRERPVHTRLPASSDHNPRVRSVAVTRTMHAGRAQSSARAA